MREVLLQFEWLQPQDAPCASRVKVSYDVVGLALSASDQIRRALHAAGQDVTLVYSEGLHLDVLPLRTGKGRATRFIIEEWGVGPDQVLAFGDSGNDLELLSSGFRGTIVANAQPELRSAIGPRVYRSPMAHADGVIDGFRHWTRAPVASW